MPKRPNFQPIETASGWMVSIPPSMNGNGKRERKFFKTEAEAKKLSKTLSGQFNRGERGGVVDAGLARMAAASAELLEGTGTSIFEASKIVAEMAAMLEPYGITPLEACRQAVERYKASGINETFRARYNRFVAANETRWRDRYRIDMSKIPRWVGDAFMSLPCASITPAVIEAALRKNGAASASTVTARKTRVVAALTSKEKKAAAGEIRIMTVRQCAAMLRACRSAAERQAIALLIFAGIRPDGELGRLDWQDVGAKDITVHPETSKTGSDRFIPITPRLHRLLRGHPATGTVIPPNWPRRIQAIRKAAGIAGEQDITRHTFASHFLALHSEEETKRAMGHTQGSQTLFRHYRRAVTTEAGRKFFA